MKTCHKCRHEVTSGRTTGRREECAFCKADLHCCLNCALYDLHASKQCREPVAEPVKIKDKANYCDYFAFPDRPATGFEEKEIEKKRKALDDLFKR